MKEYYSTYSTTKGFVYHSTQQKAIDYQKNTNDNFVGGIMFYKEDDQGNSLLNDN